MRFQTLATFASLSGLTVVLAFAGQATAAPIWDVTTLTSDGSNIDTSGVIDTPFAFNIDHDSDPDDATVNGILFTGFPGSQSPAPVSVTSGMLTITDNDTLEDATGATNGTGDDYNTSFSIIMDEYYQTSGSGAMNNPDFGPIVIAIDSLTVGQPYRLQMLHDTEVESDRGQKMIFDNGTGTPIESAEFFTSRDALGKISSIDFVASQTTHEFEVFATDGRGQLNGIVLQTVIPEPASVALLGLGGLMMLPRRRLK